MTHSDIEPSSFLRFGHVSAYDAKRHMARVIFPAMNNVVSAWLPVSISCANGNYSESHIDTGTHVACIMAGLGTESGVVIGCIYDDSNTPHTGDENITCIEFQDGTRLSYDRQNHSLGIDAKGEINITATGAVTVYAESITAYAENITANAQGDITANASGSFTANAGGSVSLIADGGATVIGSSNGNVSVTSQNVNLDSKFVTIESSDNISLTSSSSTIQSSDKINILSAEEITLKAPSVNIEED